MIVAIYKSQYRVMNRGKRVITEEEEDEEPVQLGVGDEPNDNTMAMCLIGKLWTERPFNTFALMETMVSIEGLDLS